MAFQQKSGRLSAVQKRVILWSLAAMVLGLGANAYFYSLEGAKGLYRWNQTGLFRSIILMSFLPMSVAILSFPLEKLKHRLPSVIVRGLALVLAFVVSLASLGLFGFVVVSPRLGALEPAKLTLVNPSEGLGRVDRGEPAFSTGTSSPAETETADSDAPLIRMTFSSDPHWGAETSNPAARAAVLASIAEHRPDVFFLLGDTVETGSQSTQWDYALSDLEAIIPKVPLRPVMGNHDALFGGQYLYRKAFFPKSFSSDSGSPYYYSIKDDAVTVLVLDLPWGTEEFGRAQKKWLETTLESADQSKPIIVLSHSFFYASGYDDPVLDKPWYDHKENIPAMAALFERHGVDLVVSGHNHYQELLEHKGVHYAVIGAMGGKPDPAPAYISPASEWIAVAAFGRLNVDITRTELLLAFKGENGAVLHEKRIAY